ERACGARRDFVFVELAAKLVAELHQPRLDPIAVLTLGGGLGEALRHAVGFLRDRRELVGAVDGDRFVESALSVTPNPLLERRERPHDVPRIPEREPKYEEKTPDHHLELALRSDVLGGVR